MGRENRFFSEKKLQASTPRPCLLFHRIVQEQHPIWLKPPRDCPELPARNPTTETTEHTEREPSSFRGFRVLRGLKAIETNPGTVPSYRPGILPPNSPNTRNESLLLSVVSVYSVV